MAIPREIIDQVRERTSILEVVQRHVTLKKKGNSWVGLCPFHQEKTPSFNVVPHKGIFHCFGCGEGGDVFKFIMKVQGLGFMEAIKELAGPAGVTIQERELSPDERQRLRKRATLYDICEAAAAWYSQVLLARPEGAPGRAYLEQRGMTRETIERFRVGYAPAQWTGLLEHLHRRGFPEDLAVSAGLARRREQGSGAYDFFRGRVMFPILDERQRVLSFGGRLVQNTGSGDREAPKYFNGIESDIYHKQRVLYGLSHARAAIQREDRAILVEGYFDVTALAQAGVAEVVATCGTALTTDQLQILRRFSPRVVALFDADAAGVKAAVRAMPLFADAGMEALRLEIPGAKDPDEFIQAHGAEAFNSLLERTAPLMELVIRWNGEQHGTSPLGRQRSLQALAPLVARFPQIARAALVRRIADLLYLPESQVAQQVRRARTGRQDPAEQRGTPATRIPRGLADLLWLLVHHSQVVAPLVEACDPALVSESHAIRDCVGALLAGRELASIMEEAEDPALRSLLARVAATSELYPQERAEAAARQILARLEIARIEEQLTALHRAIQNADDMRADATLGLFRERARLTLLLNERRRILRGQV